MFNVAEVAPAVPAVVEMLPPLLILSGLLFALGCATLIRYFAHSILSALAGIFSFLPFVGSITEAAIRSLEQWIVHGLGQGIAKIEGSIGHQWHNLSRIAHFWWNVTVRMAHATWEIAKSLERFALTHDLHHLLHDLRKLIHSLRATATTALHRVIRLEHTVTRTVAQGVYPRLRAVEHKVERTLPREIKSARALAREAEDGVARLWDWTRSLADNPAIAAAVATAIAALGLVGLDLIRCRESRNIYNKRGCNVWSDLDALLGLFAAAELALHVDDIVKIIEELVDPAVAVMNKAK